jgi:hypothetical protein
MKNLDTLIKEALEMDGEDEQDLEVQDIGGQFPDGTVTPVGAAAADDVEDAEAADTVDPDEVEPEDQEDIDEEEKIDDEESCEEEDDSPEDDEDEESPSVDETIQSVYGDNLADLSDDINALASILGEDDMLSDDDLKKVKAIFEAAVKNRSFEVAKKVVQKLDEQSDARLEREVNAIIEKIDGYMDYVTEEWFGENEVAIEASMKVALAEGIIEKLSEIVPAGTLLTSEEIDWDAQADSAAQIDEMKSDMDKLVRDNAKLKKEIKKHQFNSVVFDVSESKGLAKSQSLKLKSLVESVDYSDIDDLKHIVEDLADTYFPRGENKKHQINEDVDDDNEDEANESWISASEKMLNSGQTR